MTPAVRKTSWNIGRREGRNSLSFLIIYKYAISFRGNPFSNVTRPIFFQDKEVQYTLTCLVYSGSKTIREWKETDKKITFCYNEARDNSKFIQAMETCCHSLYLDDPVSTYIY